MLRGTLMRSAVTIDGIAHGNRSRQTMPSRLAPKLRIRSTAASSASFSPCSALTSIVKPTASVINAILDAGPRPSQMRKIGV